MRALKGLSLFGGLAVVLTLFFVIGCSNNTPVQPNVPNSLEMGRLNLDKDLVVASSGYETFDSSYIDRDEGGEIEVERGSAVHVFNILPNSISQDTLITIHTYNDDVLKDDKIVFEFGPDGLLFASSSLLEFDTAEFKEEVRQVKLYYFDPAQDEWVLSQTVNVDQNGIAQFIIPHFSKYAISD